MPDHRLATHVVDELLHARLELSDVDGARLQLRRGSFEDVQLLETARRGAQERGLADAMPADQKHRSPRRLGQPLRDELDDLLSSAREKGRGTVVRPGPDSPDTRKKVGVHGSCAPRGECAAKLGTENVLVLVHELVEIVAEVIGDAPIEDAFVEAFTGTQALGDERRDHMVAHALLDGRERSSDERRRAVLEKGSEDVRVLSRRRAFELAPRPLLELRRRVASKAHRREGDARHELVPIAAEREQVVPRQVALGQRGRGALEGVVLVELVRVEVLGIELRTELRGDLADEPGELALVHVRLECARSSAACPALTAFTVRSCRQAVRRVWIYVALGVGIVVALNALIVAAVVVAAQHAHAAPPAEEMDAHLRALLLSHVRPLNSEDVEVDADQHREAA